MSLKIAIILGARPQFIKASALSRSIHELNKDGASISEIIVHTGQHYDIEMSDIFFNELQIPQPTVRLTTSSRERPERLGEMLNGLSRFFKSQNPDVALVFGDTDTTLSGALCASQLGIPVAHVESGLRSFNREMPEENNRILTDHISQFLFCPTEAAVLNLRKEGIFEKKNSKSIRIVQSGDIQLETLRHYAFNNTPAPGLLSKLKKFLKPNEPFALATIHRAENTKDKHRLNHLLQGIKSVSNSLLPVVIPLHPRTRQKIQEYGLNLKAPRILNLPPQGFLNIIELLKKTSLVMTDSGGLQKEAYFMRKPCITLREETEWRELVEHGFNRLVGFNTTSILEGATKMLEGRYNWTLPLYGKGNTAEVILKTLINTLS